MNISNDQEEIASLIFTTIDWQSIVTLVDDLFRSNELDEFEENKYEAIKKDFKPILRNGIETWR